MRKKKKYKEKPELKNKNEVVEYLYNAKLVRSYIYNTAKWVSPELDDLEQDIFIILLNMDERKLLELYNKDELTFFICRIITNQIHSVTSPFYIKYKKFLHLSEEITQNIKDRY